MSLDVFGSIRLHILQVNRSRANVASRMSRHLLTRYHLRQGSLTSRDASLSASLPGVYRLRRGAIIPTRGFSVLRAIRYPQPQTKSLLFSIALFGR